ncbi:hypothetical protein DITRI_Ditri19aG0024400 [Diplodiscus trichospermus]
MISFRDRVSMEKAIENGPWSIMGNVMNLKMWELDRAVQEIDFTKLEIDNPNWDKGVGRSFMRLRVSIEIEKPLIAGFWVPRDEGRKI